MRHRAPDYPALTLKARGCRRKNSRLLASSQLLVYSELAITQRGEFITQECALDSR